MRTLALLAAFALFGATPALAADVKTGRHQTTVSTQSVIERGEGENLLRVRVSNRHTLPDGRVELTVSAVWGDLENDIKKCGRQYYKPWDGGIAIENGSVQLVRKLAFDDRSGRNPAEGSGVDKIDAVTSKAIKWDAAVVGATDGIESKLTFASASDSAILTCGEYAIPLRPDMVPEPKPAAEKKREHKKPRENKAPAGGKHKTDPVPQGDGGTPGAV